MVKNMSGIEWGYYTKPKSDFFVNTPLLIGFEDKEVQPPFSMEFEPIHMTGVQAANIFDGTQDEKDLYNLYLLWKNFMD